MIVKKLEVLDGPAFPALLPSFIRGEMITIRHVRLPS